MYKILIVEDDGVIASAVAAHLHSWGWETSCVVDFQHVMEAFAAFSPHLVLLDITLPFYDGYHWCAEIRKVSKAPVVFLSSAAGARRSGMALPRRNRLCGRKRLLQKWAGRAILEKRGERK